MLKAEYIVKQHSKAVTLWSACIRNNTDVKSLTSKFSPGSVFNKLLRIRIKIKLKFKILLPSIILKPTIII